MGEWVYTKIKTQYANPMGFINARSTRPSYVSTTRAIQCCLIRTTGTYPITDSETTGIMLYVTCTLQSKWKASYYTNLIVPQPL